MLRKDKTMNTNTIKVMKRNGTEVEFDITKIENAIQGAVDDGDGRLYIEPEVINSIAVKVMHMCELSPHTVNVEEISDLVEKELMSIDKDVAKNYIVYRYQRMLARKSNTTDEKVLSLLERANEEAMQENSNKNPIINSTQRDYMAGEVSRDLTKRILLPADIVKADEEGIIHFHDSDYYAQHMHNCCLVNLEDMLQNGTVITGTQITKPKSFLVACNVATQIVAQVASNQYGGQTISLAHLAPFVDISRQKYRREVRKELESAGLEAADEAVNRIAEERVKKEIKDGVQTIQYQLVTLMTTNGQTPFVSVFMYIDEVPEGQTREDLVLIINEVLRQRIKGLPNEQGVWITPAFPKLLYVLDEDNVTEESKYWETTKLAAKCTAKRMVPDYISAKVMRELKQGDVYGCMGCRSFLTVDRTTENLANAMNYVSGQHKYYGRFNQGVVTLNLVDAALSSHRDEEKFWTLMDERLELCHRALRLRHERLLGTVSDVAPILWQYGALARLKKGEKIDRLLYGGYSTISLGYAGLYECVFYMKGVSHTTQEGREFGLKVMQMLNDYCTKWKKAENIDYSVYGTPLESTTYKFAKCLQRRFGVIPEVTDHNYITNSYHINVREKIDAFSKLSQEAQFQKLSPGGAISYVEIPDVGDNIDAVLAIMQHIYNTILYAEMNTKSDYCQVCGYDGEIKIVEDAGKLVWECPCCGNRDQKKMNVARRTCGYIGSNWWNQGRTQEIKERVVHLSQTQMKAEPGKAIAFPENKENEVKDSRSA